MYREEGKQERRDGKKRKATKLIQFKKKSKGQPCVTLPNRVQCSYHETARKETTAADKMLHVYERLTSKGNVQRV